MEHYRPLPFKEAMTKVSYVPTRWLTPLEKGYINYCLTGIEPEAPAEILRRVQPESRQAVKNYLQGL